MYQVIFSPKSAHSFNELPFERQLVIIKALGALSPTVLEEAKEPVGRFKHNQTTFYRFRFEDLRFYFTLQQECICCEYILHKNTWADFRMRNNLEKEADQEIESKPSFWNFLEKKEEK